jgi:IS5 family transposase
VSGVRHPSRDRYSVPVESTILRSRYLLEQHGLTQAIVDATIIAAPSSTKNASASRDPEMKQTP